MNGFMQKIEITCANIELVRIFCHSLYNSLGNDRSTCISNIPYQVHFLLHGAINEIAE